MVCGCAISVFARWWSQVTYPGAVINCAMTPGGIGSSLLEDNFGMGKPGIGDRSMPAGSTSLSVGGE